MAQDGGAGGRRRRFDGVLGAADLARARSRGVPLAFDPVQIGWVPLSVLEEEDAGVFPDAPLSWRVGPPLPEPVKRVTGTPVYPVGRDIGLRPWVEDDLATYRALMAEPDLWRFMPEPPPGLLADADLLALIALSSEGDHHCVRAVIHEGAPVGQVRLEFAPCGSRAEISYWLGSGARGRGLGRLAVARFLDRILQRLPGLTALTARVHPENAASTRLLASLDFRPSTRAATGLGPRGRDRGDWPVYLRPLSPAGAGNRIEASP